MAKTSESSIDRLNLFFRAFRAKIFKPILVVFNVVGLTANHITNFRFLGAIIFPFWFYYRPASASIFIVIIIFFDTLDGALARFQNKASDKGKFLDVFTDRIVHSSIVFSFFWLGAGVHLVAYQLVIMPVAYLLSSIKKGETLPTDWIIQTYPRLSWVSLWPIVAFLALIWLKVDYLNESLWLSNILASIMSLYYFVILQAGWKAKKTQ
ncbi:MAG: hypothetical protein COU10_03605 [Candidatus Harrisonbacteria bacterium CG10_big_fil_rev_8_21_14_0_10_45_28]|uniref:CDP-alcohol phosphatidyltransferase family protein n=1 Tax=Candidatus Harrisonbacteria bacterium CG10_big_fil_rev_8_21_14_0_10_45_28 TaxID=1974586 RepID=A0A2H0UML5_9BACT|nr:MAG: hypothetical protein COU10_03605 [Candidatus Harrisonbacteria bacterium CG10_big_fil_rev_8_21_14_0_10_45_28]